MNPTSFLIDLGAPFFWVFLGVAAVALLPLTVPHHRRVVLAVLNIGFIACLLGAWGALAALLIATACWAAVRANSSAINSGRTRTVAVAFVGGVVLVLFVVHKLGTTAGESAPSMRLQEFLAATGFSYVALRCVDLLRAGAERPIAAHLLDVVNYLFPFNMLAAGPIQAWHDFETKPVREPARGREAILDAVERIVHGVFKKFVLARALEIVFLTRFRAPWPYLLLEIQLYCIWVYLDFSAYSDIAVGAGRLVGVETPENFNRPFGARNIIEFWSRWHISLSAFVRRNIFIPVQLTVMRRLGVGHAMLATSVAFAVAFIAVGLWHSISLRFALWGALHAAALITCSLYGRFLSARLGRNGLARYLANPG